LRSRAYPLAPTAPQRFHRYSLPVCVLGGFCELLPNLEALICVVISVLLTIASRLSVHCGTIVADFNGSQRASFQVLGFDRHKARILVEFFDGSDLYSLGPPHIRHGTNTFHTNSILNFFHTNFVTQRICILSARPTSGTALHQH
jgi:hypothetical protein